MPRKPTSRPSIASFLTKHPQQDALVLILMGHLSIEYLLVEILKLKCPHVDEPWNWNFPNKVNKCVEIGVLTDEAGEALKAFNNVRNDFAHILGHRLTFDEVFGLAKKVAGAGFDFTDDTIWADRQVSEEWYGIEDVVNEVVSNIYLDLAYVLNEEGGDDFMS
jgi:hypothetical protein